MDTEKTITGIVLAGGKSLRMGQDKGLIAFNNKPFMQYIIDALTPVVNKIIIVSNNTGYAVFQHRIVRDLIENAGPLGGLYTGLYHTQTAHNLVLSCDIPLINTAVLKKLVERSQSGADVVQLQVGGETMPLIALYKKSCLYKLRALLQAGERRLRVALQEFEVQTIALGETWASCTANINTPIHLKQIINAANY